MPTVTANFTIDHGDMLFRYPTGTITEEWHPCQLWFAVDLLDQKREYDGGPVASWTFTIAKIELWTFGVGAKFRTLNDRDFAAARCFLTEQYPDALHASARELANACCLSTDLDDTAFVLTIPPASVPKPGLPRKLFAGLRFGLADIAERFKSALDFAVAR